MPELTESDIKVIVQEYINDKCVLRPHCLVRHDGIDMHFALNEKALQIQTKELERRLDILNGEADRLRNMQATYVPQGEYAIAMKSISTDIAKLNSFKDNLIGRMVVTAGGVAIVVSLLVFIMTRLIRN